jgi:hypothetical protein
LGVDEGYWDKDLGKDDTFVAYGFGEILVGFFISHYKQWKFFSSYCVCVQLSLAQK